MGSLVISVFHGTQLQDQPCAALNAGDVRCMQQLRIIGFILLSFLLFVARVDVDKMLTPYKTNATACHVAPTALNCAHARAR